MSIDPPRDHSQHGEYLSVVRPFFKELRKTQRFSRTAVECGVHGPENSNTYDLVTKDGWEALWIDASPQALEMCREHESDSIELLEGALLPLGSPETATLYIHNSIGHDSLLEDWKPKTHTAATFEVPVFHLATSLDLRAYPHDFALLSIDLEGSDEPVLVEFLECSPFRPWMIIVEHQALTWLSEAALERAGYERLTRIGANDIWTRKP